jgi:hypothetical protein
LKNIWQHVALAVFKSKMYYPQSVPSYNIFSFNVDDIFSNIFIMIAQIESGCVAELANASVTFHGDPVSNLGVDKKYFLVLLALGLNSNM